jgi:hypothetical protein
MRVKLSEIYFGQMLSVLGALQIGAGKATVRGFPAPLWTAYVLLAAGIAIPLLAWYLRRPGQTPEIDKP